MNCNKKYIILFLCCFQQIIYGQIGKYTKVDKIYKDTYNFLEEASIRKKQWKDKNKYVVYSDRVNNNAYLDRLGLKQGKTQDFLTSYFVIDETTDFLELVKFDASQIGKPKGLFSFFYGDTYNFKDVKNVTYVGWMQKNNLLHFSHAKVSQKNLKPLVYYLGINNPKILINSKKYLKKDSVYTFTDPSLSTRAKKLFNSNQFVYLYKYNSTKTAALISNKAYIQASDSLNRTMGWVPVELLKNIGQKKVWNTDTYKEVVFLNADTTKYDVKTRDINNSFIFQPEKKMNKQTIDSLSIACFTPLNVWDHYDNKLINVKGGDVFLREIPLIKQGNQTFNLHFIFNCSNTLRQQLLLQIASLQRIGLLISEDQRYKDLRFTFSASSYGCGKYYKFDQNDSFALWLDYLQKVFLNDATVATNSYNNTGIEKCLTDIVSSASTNKKFENNIVLIVGNANLEIALDNPVFNDLAKQATRLLFFQLNNTSDKKHQDFILKSKQILDTVAQQYSAYTANYIIENELLLNKNLYLSLESEQSNMYLYDAPEKSMYTGGVVFPKINNRLDPTSVDVALDSLLSKTVAGNNKLIKSLENGGEKLGFLRSKPTQRVASLLKKDTINALLIPRINKNEVYLEETHLNLTEDKLLETGYLISKKELELLIEGYKSIIPLVYKTVKRKDRRALYKKYKAYYKELNKLLFYKELKKKNTVGELLYIKTGFEVNNNLLNSIKIVDIKRRSRLSNKDYIVLMQSLRNKILALEKIVETPKTKTFIDGGKQTYYYIAKSKLL